MKILIIKNRFTKKLDFQKGIEHLEKNAPIKLSIEEIETDFELEFKKVGNGTYSGVVPTGYYDKLRKLVPENKYNAVVLVYGNDAPGIRVSITENEPLYKNTDVVSLVKVTDRGMTFNHELFHCFFYKLARRGIVLHDPMDVAIVNGQGVGYYNNKCLDCKESNRTIALQALKPFWSTITDLGQAPIPAVTPIKTLKKTHTIELNRSYDDGFQALGNLFYGDFKCSTLERPWKNNQPNISCIPKGEYTVKWTFSPKFMRYTYEVQNVPGRTGIRIHTGNFVTDISGCIILGFGYEDLNKDGRLDIIKSDIYIKQFEQLLNKQDFKLIIK